MGKIQRQNLNLELLISLRQKTKMDFVVRHNSLIFISLHNSLVVEQMLLCLLTCVKSTPKLDYEHKIMSITIISF